MPAAKTNFAGSKNFLRNVVAAMEEALESLGQKEEEAIREEISIPVGGGEVDFVRSDGTHIHFTASKGVVRSQPGQPPRKETGNLLDSVRHSTTSDRTSATVSIGAGPAIAPEDGTDYAPILEDPQQLNRPYIRPSFKRATDAVGGIMTSKLSGVTA